MRQGLRTALVVMVIGTAVSYNLYRQERATAASSLVEHLDAAQLSAAEPRDDWGAQLETLRRSILQGLHARR